MDRLALHRHRGFLDRGRAFGKLVQDLVDPLALPLGFLDVLAERLLDFRIVFQALDLMWDHLVNGASLPPSQVVRTVPRGPGAPAIGPANLPPIRREAAEDALIRFDGTELSIPE